MHRAFKQDADGASSSLGTTRPPESRELFSDLSTVGGGGTNNGERPPKRTFDGSPRKELKRKRREKAGKMASFIFFDLESTGLFTRDQWRDHSKLDEPAKIADELFRYTLSTQESECPHMTEASFVVVSRGAFEAAVEKMRKKAGEQGENPEITVQTPVPANIHTRQLRPNLSEDQWRMYENIRRPETARITRAVLSEKATFAEEWPGLRHVLKTAPKPTCIVAHNALRYDMRVLHVELQRAALLEDGWLPEEVYFVDSLLAFRQIDREDATHISSLVGGTDWMTIASMCSTPPDPPRARPARIPMIEEREEDVVEETPPEDQHAAGDGLLQLPAALEGGGFTTPERRPRCPGTASAPAKLHTSRALFPEVFLDFSHPLNYIRSEEWTVAKRKRVDGRVFRKVAGKWQYNVEAAMENAKRRGAFRQENLYMSIFCDTYNAHQAQDDCEALMQICLAYGPSFLEYADTMAADIIY
uniref:Exonuclease domain-containing protein n=1 Tax=Pristionchus pacificus TaxID=54126 RepID=A0A8R1UQ41_PRIPA